MLNESHLCNFSSRTHDSIGRSFIPLVRPSVHPLVGHAV